MKNCTVDLSDRFPSCGKKPDIVNDVRVAFEAAGYRLLKDYEKSAKKLDSICPSGHEYSVLWSNFKNGVRCSACSGQHVSQEYVEAAFISEGYTLISAYKNAHKKLDFICPLGHQHSIRWSSFQKGVRCSICSGRFLSHEYIEEAFRSEGYVLISKYIKSGEKLDFICPKGHKHSITWSNFNRGKRCAYCAGQVVTHGDVEDAFKAEGYELRSRYKNANSKLDFTCPRGHNHSITWASFRCGRRCGICSGRFLSHEEVDSAFKSEGYILKSQYRNNTTKLRFICPNGHEYFTTWADFQCGGRCGICSGRYVSHEDVEAAFKAEGYTLKSKYVKSDKKLDFTCSNGHNHSITWNSFQHGSRCAFCAESGYSAEKSGLIYYVRFDMPSGGHVYKIGITNRSVKKRFVGEKTPYTILWQQRFEDGRIPQQMEREILEKHKKHRYKGNELKSGNTECFTRDILGYDKDAAQLSLLIS